MNAQSFIASTKKEWSKMNQNSFKQILHELFLICFSNVVLASVWCILTRDYYESHSRLIYDSFNLFYEFKTLFMINLLTSMKNKFHSLMFWINDYRISAKRLRIYPLTFQIFFLSFHMFLKKLRSHLLIDFRRNENEKSLSLLIDRYYLNVFFT